MNAIVFYIYKYIIASSDSFAWSHQINTFFAPLFASISKCPHVFSRHLNLWISPCPPKYIFIYVRLIPPPNYESVINEIKTFNLPLLPHLICIQNLFVFQQPRFYPDDLDLDQFTLPSENMKIAMSSSFSLKDESVICTSY